MNLNKNWISKLKDDTKIIDLYVPGSHDSTSYQNAYYQETNNFFGKIAKYKYLRPCIEKFTLTQNKSLYQQLNIGIRLFDIRFSFINNIWWCSHALPNEKWDNIFDQMLAFLTINRNETIFCIIAKDFKQNCKIPKIKFKKSDNILIITSKNIKELKLH